MRDFLYPEILFEHSTLKQTPSLHESDAQYIRNNEDVVLDHFHQDERRISWAWLAWKYGEDVITPMSRHFMEILQVQANI
jgi:hypothetical protein